MRLLFGCGRNGRPCNPRPGSSQGAFRAQPGARVLFAGTARGVENRLVPAASFPLELVEVRALQGQSPATRLRNLLRLPRALWQASRLQDKFQPDVVLGVGDTRPGL